MGSFWRTLGVVLWQSLKALWLLGPALFFGAFFPPILIIVAILFIVALSDKLHNR